MPALNPPCDVDVASGHGGEVTKWTIMHDGDRKTVHICARHARPLESLWERFKPPQRAPRETPPVLDDLSEIPIV